jgi:uncharacterized protein
MRQPTRFWMFCLLSLGCTISGCQRQADVYDYDRVGILEEIAQSEILPSLTYLRFATDSLRSSVTQFTQLPTVSTLTAARAQWIKANLGWKACEIFQIGPVKDRRLQSRISKWPTDSGLIEAELGSVTAMDQAYFEALGATSRGLPALEYLLFGGDTSMVLQQFTTDSAAVRRQDYLLGLAENLHFKVGELQQLWMPSGENYAYEFAHSTATGLEDPIGQLVNAMISMMEEVAKSKIGKPLGKFDLGILHPDAVESTYANVSKELIRANVVALQAAYLGTGHTGLDMALDELHASYGVVALSATITQQFTTTIAAIDQVTLPLQDALVTQHDQVEAAYQAMKELIVLFKADLCSAMSITVTVTDADGD